MSQAKLVIVAYPTAGKSPDLAVLERDRAGAFDNYRIPELTAGRQCLVERVTEDAVGSTKAHVRAFGGQASLVQSALHHPDVRHPHLHMAFQLSPKPGKEVQRFVRSWKQEVVIV